MWDGKKPLGEGSMVKAILAADLDPAFRNELTEKIKSLDFANYLTCCACTAGCVFSDLHPSNDPVKCCVR